MIQFFGLVYELVLFKMQSVGEDGQKAAVVDIKNALMEYEKQASIIETQLQMCLRDHEMLRKNSTDVVDENRRLLIQLKEKCEHESGSQNLVKLEESLMIRNLQQQLSLLASERDALKELWLQSAKTVDDLQSDLSRCKEEMENKAMYKQIDVLKRDYSDAISLLEMKLSNVKGERDNQKQQNVELHAEIQLLRKKMDDISELNKSLDSKVTDLKVHNDELQKKCFSLESEHIQQESCLGVIDLDHNTNKEVENIKFQKLIAERNELQKALEQCHNTIEILSKQAYTDKDKVKEAVKLVEDTLVDKENFIARSLQAEEECKRLQKVIKGLIEEAGLQVSRELAASKENHSKEVMALQMDLKIAKQDIANKYTEIDQRNKECKRLENLVSQMTLKGQEPTKLDKKLEMLYTNLHASEERNLQILSENEGLKKSFESLYKRHMSCKLEKAMFSEQIFLMEQQIQRLTEDLITSSERANALTAEIQNLNLKTSHENRNSNDDLLSKLQQIQERNVATTKELHRHVEAHNDIARKWKNEVVALTEKFENKLKEVKNDRKIERKKRKAIAMMKSRSQDLSDMHRRSSENTNGFQDDNN